MPLPSGTFLADLYEYDIYYADGPDNSFTFYSYNKDNYVTTTLGSFVVIATSVPGTLQSQSDSFGIVNNSGPALLFQITDTATTQTDSGSVTSYGTALFETNGTPAGTAQIANFPGCAGLQVLTTLGNLTYFTTGPGSPQIYVTDGTSAGTVLLLNGGTGLDSAFEGTAGGLAFVVLSDGGTQTLYALNGAAADTAIVAANLPAADDFSISYDGVKATVDVTSGGAVTGSYWVSAEGAVSSAGDEYVWTGPASGAWNDAQNWQDVTTGANPAGVAPGALDSVTFPVSVAPYYPTQDISGIGRAAYLTFEGQDTLTGTLTAGDLTVRGADGDGAILDIAGGGTLFAVDADIANNLAGEAFVSISGTGAKLQITGTLADGGPGLVVSDGGKLQAAALVIDGDDGENIQVDSLSSIEIGTLGGAALGALTVDDGATLYLPAIPPQDNFGFDDFIAANAVDNGVIAVAGPLAFDGAALSGSGIISIAAGGKVEVYASTGSGLTFELGAGATLTVAQRVAGGTIELGGTGDVLALNAYSVSVDGSNISTIGNMAAAIRGFAPSDIILVGTPADAATYVAGPNSLIGKLVIWDAGSAVTTLTLQGDYAGDSFSVIPVGYQGSEIIISVSATGTISPGTDTGDQFLWVGPANGEWNDAANWEDVSSGANPATIAPGTLDTATIRSSDELPDIVGGAGDAATLSLPDTDLILGSFNAGTLILDDTDIYDGGVISAASASDGLDADVTVTGAGSALLVAGLFSFAGTELTAAQGGIMQFGNLALDGYAQMLAADSLSSIEIGTLGDAAAGAITVDDGVTVNVSGEFGGSAMQFDAPVVVDNGLIAPTTNTDLDFYGSLLTGSGIVALQAGDDVNVQDSVGGGIGFSLGNDATLGLGTAASGTSIFLTGNDTITVYGNYTLTADGLSYAPDYAMGAAITGFNVSDLILLGGDVVSYAAASVSGTGELLVTQGGSVIATLALDGDYAGDQFVALPGDAGTEILLALPGGSLSSGTTDGNNFNWTGPLSGAWDNAANWVDTSTGMSPASIAPGILDRVSIVNTSFLTRLISGTGDAASISFIGSYAVAGTLSAANISATGLPGLDGFLDITAGGTLTAGTLDLASGTNFAVSGAKSRLLVTNVLNLEPSTIGYDYTLAVTGGATAEAAGLALSGYSTIYVDGASSFEVGTLGGAAIGALRIDPGAQISISGTVGDVGIASSVIDDGLIIAGAALNLSGGTLSGVGEVSIAAGQYITSADDVTGQINFVLGADAQLLLGAVEHGVGVALGGPDDTLILDGSFAGDITNFAPGDAIILENIRPTTLRFVSGTGLELGGTSAVTLDLLGSFASHDFSLSSDGINTTITTDSAPCYCAGTKIRTAAGDVAVEHLRIGDGLETGAGNFEKIKWIGERVYSGNFIAGQHLKLPVCISRNAIADNVPARDLFVSPGHAIQIGKHLVPAWRLINGVTITQAEKVDRVHYFHIELDMHCVILAENCRAESFFDDDCRGQFHNAGEFTRLYGRQAPGKALKRLESGVPLDRIQRRLARRAGLPALPRSIDGPVRGFLDLAGPELVTGWIQWEAAPERPVTLEIYAAGKPVAQLLANKYRADLRDAKLGSGCHAFEWRIPKRLKGPFEARVSCNGVILRRSDPIPQPDCYLHASA